MIISALQNSLFRFIKEPVLHGKSAYIASQYRHFCNIKAQLTFSLCTFLYNSEPFEGQIIVVRKKIQTTIFNNK